MPPPSGTAATGTPELDGAAATPTATGTPELDGAAAMPIATGTPKELPLPPMLESHDVLRLPPDASMDLGEVAAQLGIDRALDELDSELIGLAAVKERLREIGALLLVDRLRAGFGLAAPRPNLHMCFSGPPGTGKTTVATKLASILHSLGYLPSARLLTVGREDLVGQYVGHTGPKTKDVLKRAMGGVLFIDEAYSLHRPDNERDYGQEAIEILLQVMEEQRDRLVVVLAGYSDRMDGFFSLNPGLRSRIAHHIDFPRFELDELVQIGHKMLAEQAYELSEDAEPVFADYVAKRSSQPHFANARSIRNAIDRARLRQAARLLSTNARVDREALRLIKPADLLKSRIFNEPTRKEPAPRAGRAPRAAPAPRAGRAPRAAPGEGPSRAH